MSTVATLQATANQMREAIGKASIATDAQAAVNFMLQAHRQSLEAIEKLAIAVAQS